MKKFFGSLIALTVLSSAAFAADMPLRKAPPLAPEYATDWSGFSIGLLGGYGWADAKPDFGGKTLSGFHDPSMRGWVAGGYAGYNWNPGSFVLGLEGDYTQADITETQTLGESFTIRTKVDRLASARARVGYLVTPHLLAYGTGGIGFGSGVAEIVGSPFSARGNGWGWVAGAGLEYSLGAKLKLRAEYLHYDLGTVNFASGIPFSLNVNAAVTVDVVRAGLGFQF